MGYTRANVPVVTEGTFDSVLRDAVTPILAEHQPADILEAGCGRMWTWDLGDLRFKLTGVDVDEDALLERVEERGDLAEWFAGDLRTIQLNPESYDMVYSAYALEHIAGAEQVLDRMEKALRPGGLMVIRIPDRQSVYSLLTRITPHWLHVQYKRRIRKSRLAGTPGHGPYPVVYDRVIGLDGIVAWADRHSISVQAVYGDNSHMKFFGRARPLASVALRLVSLLTLRRFTDRYSNLAFVLTKPK